VVGAAREIAEARGAQVHALLSVAGNRPTGLHAPIGAAAARLAHSLIVTGGSLRGGSPATTLGPLLAGARSARAAPVDLVPDRRTAICEALARAAKDDVVLLLGRGARPRLSRDLAGNGPAFDDRVVAREELRALLDREFTPLPLDPAALGR
jgi:UDP-N-acetylmuramoyl-L-alanyl-D-glutamate--2,6-diaminopimelate ligase